MADKAFMKPTCMERHLLAEGHFIGASSRGTFLFGKTVFLPLSRGSIVILSLFFQLCDFTPVILKRMSSLPLVWMSVI